MNNDSTMKILTRQQFADYFNKIVTGLGDPCSVLWQAEHINNPCKFFVRLRKPVDCEHMSDFHVWCENYTDGEVRCFSSGARGEWWGFTNKDDIVLWMLKWG